MIDDNKAEEYWFVILKGGQSVVFNEPITLDDFLHRKDLAEKINMQRPLKIVHVIKKEDVRKIPFVKEMEDKLWDQRRFNNKRLSFAPDFNEDTFLAFDVNVSSKDIGRLAKQGYQIVCCAKEGETDESFLERAFARGAQVVFSQDADIGNIIEKQNYSMSWFRWVD